MAPDFYLIHKTVILMKVYPLHHGHSFLNFSFSLPLADKEGRNSQKGVDKF